MIKIIDGYNHISKQNAYTLISNVGIFEFKTKKYADDFIKALEENNIGINKIDYEKQKNLINERLKADAFDYKDLLT